MSELTYQERGNPRGQPIVFLHGFMGGSDDWDEVVAAMGSSYRCIAIDLPGHGGSHGLDYPDCYRMEGACQAVLDLLDELEVPESCLVGYSMGGRLALYLAIEAPARFSRLVLESASPGITADTERQERCEVDELRARRLESGDFPAFLDEWYQQPLFAYLKGRSELLDRMKRRRVRNQPEELARSLRAMGTGVQPSLWGVLPHLQMPTLAVVGASDGKFVEIAQRMALESLAVRTVVISNAGHAVHAEYPGVFARLVTDFLLPQSALGFSSR